MPLDIKIAHVTGDLVVLPNVDLDLVVDDDLIEQRIRVRLKLWRGKWPLDPTNGTLGSSLHDLLRLPVNVAKSTAPLLVQEALQPMNEIELAEVDADIEDDPRIVTVRISYRMAGSVSSELRTTTVVIAG